MLFCRQADQFLKPQPFSGSSREMPLFPKAKAGDSLWSGPSMHAMHAQAPKSLSPLSEHCPMASNAAMTFSVISIKCK